MARLHTASNAIVTGNVMLRSLVCNELWVPISRVLCEKRETNC